MSFCEIVIPVLYVICSKFLEYFIETGNFHVSLFLYQSSSFGLPYVHQKARVCAEGGVKHPENLSLNNLFFLIISVCTGRKGGHKGRARQYTSPEEIDAQLQAEKQKAREEEEQEEGEGATGDPKKDKKSLDSDESDEDDEDYQQKRKGVEGLIDIENPNRVIQTTKKVTQLDLDGPKELSRREREEIEKQKAKERYMKMHLAGKTEQAKADLARLAIIRKQREEAARKKEEERKAKDEAAMAGKRLQSLSLNK
uniref:PDGFA associated protein 1 n=1 Tax=Chrysolophus pictus TaxID=9089 RepID=A0A8C3LWH0_CHRPC